MKELTIFNYKEKEVRTIFKNGEPWWVAKDVCNVLGLKNTSKALIEIDQEDKSDITICNDANDINRLRILNESGVYALIFKSRKPEAKKFKRWITHEVLPQIRKTGSYSVQQKLPKTKIEWIEYALKTEKEKVKLIEQKEQLQIENTAKEEIIKDQKPKAEFFDAVTDSKTAIEMSKVAKILDMNLGRNQLFQFLRDQKILRHNNEPYQQYIDCGYFRVVEQKYIKADGDININIKTLVYQRGLDFIRKLIDE